MDWRDIPSLAALRAFEAAARAGSFSLAARELNVTHAAIAQHVRAVEAHLQTSLLVRSGRGVALTKAGQRLSASLAEGFGVITTGVRAVAADMAARPLQVTLTPSFAEHWLMPRLAGFWSAHPDITVSITPNREVVDLRRDSFDLGIRYGRGGWPGLEAVHLVQADFVIVAAPALLQGQKADTFDDLATLPWIFETMHYEQRRWLTDLGLNLTACQVKQVPTLSMLLPALRVGAGVSVIAGPLVEQDIAQGRLVALMRERRQGLAYYIIHPPGQLSDRGAVFKTWLLGQTSP
ncbi:LysR family transcriptional regulator [Actibacterium sp. 188UL27-1]|uniref:LysR family transcriptional regulator n=1 Tax=Actibacterium sp. 188UL27-1 TaxID=2786961 RepID=UPI00195D5A77|nr:LysR family transcriptional regulator [Actibacterium sp. 188UL27-1]MBM7070231.1 LysR family transcriptional regulator [Actibacterium sp. 188UL27-1]